MTESPPLVGPSLIDRFSGRFPVHAMRRLRLPDGSFRYEHVSPAVSQSFGLDADALTRAPKVDHAWIHPEDRATFVAALHRSADDLTPLDEEVRVLLPGGSVRWVRSLGDPVRLADGTVVWDGVALDVTDRRVAMDRVHAAMESARAAEVAASTSRTLSSAMERAIRDVGGALWPEEASPDLEAVRDAVRALYAAAGLDAPQGGPTGGTEHLTPRQTEIADLIALGLSNREIADRTGVTEGTVKLHASRIYRRLGVRGRSQVIAQSGALLRTPSRWPPLAPR